VNVAAAGCPACTTLVTSQFGEPVAHQVLDQRGDVDNGRLRTVCGRWIVAAPMAAPLGKPCSACATLVPGAPAPGRERRRWLLRRG
jgi:hypothetical protein